MILEALTALWLSAAERPGAFGLGFGIEAPAVGVMGGGALHSKLGYGFALGAAVTYDVLPKLALRVSVNGGQTYFSRAAMQYSESGNEVSTHQAAKWSELDVGVGANYLFHRKGWTPYVGADGLLVYRGYNINFDPDTATKIEAINLANPNQSSAHDSLTLGWGVGLRGGARVAMNEWLAGLVELSLLYIPIGHDSLTNTRQARDVHTTSDSLFIARLTYSVRLSL